MMIILSKTNTNENQSKFIGLVRVFLGLLIQLNQHYANACTTGKLIRQTFFAINFNTFRNT